jgi:hypothetical protein
MSVINSVKIREVYKFFDQVLASDSSASRKDLFAALNEAGISEAQFCNAILDHSTVLKYDANQWFDFLSKVPNKILLSDFLILAKLSPSQRTLLRIQIHD